MPPAMPPQLEALGVVGALALRGGPREKITFPPAYAARRKSNRLGHFALLNTPTDGRFAESGGRDHVVETEEATAGAGDANARAMGLRARPTMRRAGHQTVPSSWTTETRKVLPVTLCRRT